MHSVVTHHRSCACNCSLHTMHSFLVTFAMTSHFWIPLCHGNLSIVTRSSFSPANIRPVRLLTQVLLTHALPHSHTHLLIHTFPSLTHTPPHPHPPLTHTHTHLPLTSCHVPTERIKDLQQRLEEEETASKNVKHLPPVVRLPTNWLLNLCQNTGTLCVI